MFTLDTVKAAAAASDLPTLRAMFVAIIHHPDQPLDSLTDPVEIVEAFDRVCGVLMYDLEFLPDDTFALIWRLGLEAGVPLIGQSYGAGANLYIRATQFITERFGAQYVSV